MNKDRLNILTRSVLIGTLIASGCAPVVTAGEIIIPTVAPTDTPKSTSLPAETEIPRVVPKIMVLGDSITEFGFGNELAVAMEDMGIQGDFTIEGHGGFTSKMILKDLESGKINVDKNIPDILLIELGTNDVLRGKYTASQTINYIEGIIMFFRDKNPNVKIVLFPIIPSAYGKRSQDRIDKLNLEYIALACSLSTKSSPVIVSPDVASDFDKKKDLIDGLHPSVSGYLKMVDSASDAIRTLLDP